MSNPRRFTSTQQLEQVLVNLYFNAIAAMPHGGKLWVNTKIDAPIDGPPTGVIEVKDRGAVSIRVTCPRFLTLFYGEKAHGLGPGAFRLRAHRKKSRRAHRSRKSTGGRNPSHGSFARRAEGRND